jgi:hypothetical protein
VAETGRRHKPWSRANRACLPTLHLVEPLPSKIASDRNCPHPLVYSLLEVPALWTGSVMLVRWAFKDCVISQIRVADGFL